MTWLILGRIGFMGSHMVREGYRRDVRCQIAYPEPQARATLINLVLGVLFYGVFAFYLHESLIGVFPMVC